MSKVIAISIDKVKKIGVREHPRCPTELRCTVRIYEGLEEIANRCNIYNLKVYISLSISYYLKATKHSVARQTSH